MERSRAAADLVAAGRCLYCVPSSCISSLPGTIWRPLTEPASCYPWSVLWRASDESGHVRAVVSCAQAMSQRLGWLTAAVQAAQQAIRVRRAWRPLAHCGVRGTGAATIAGG